jgi:hypothetical protein
MILIPALELDLSIPENEDVFPLYNDHVLIKVMHVLIGYYGLLAHLVGHLLPIDALIEPSSSPYALLVV